MTEKPDLTLEELLDGLQSPFWRWFTLECAKEWGESAFGLKVATILKTRKYEDAAPLIQQGVKDEDALAHARAINLMDNHRMDDSGKQPVEMFLGRKVEGLAHR